MVCAMEGEEELIKPITGLFLILVLSFLLFFVRPRRRLRLPPSPIGLPIIGHLHLLAPIPHQALHKLSTRHGPLIHLRLGSVRCVVASSAATAKELLRTHDLSFSDRPPSKAVSYLTYGLSDFSFAPYGAYWRFMKKLCVSELLGGRTLDQLLPIRREEVVALVQTLHDKSQERRAIDMGGELIRFTNNVISRMTMSRRCSGSEGESGEVRKLVEEISELTGKFNLADYIGLCKNLDLQGFDRRLEDVRRRFDGMMEKILKDKEAARAKRTEIGGGAKDLLDMLIDISEDASAEARLTRDNIKAFILDIFVAGTDTSAITMEWALAELINHPEILHKAREELDAVVGKNRLVEESDIPNLPYLQSIVKETLRLHPTGPLILRRSNNDSKIDGYDVPANTTVFVNVWAIGRDPERWSDPLEFYPERFMEKKGEEAMDVRGQHFELIPFGSGRRGCPGASLALQLVQSTVGAMIQCFEWKVGDGGTVVDMAEGPGLTLPRAKPLRCTPLSRLNPLPLPSIPAATSLCS
ncbi:cytochrome P450 93A3-like [Musa acuminata AAA Group]|uniref:(wild Malaysian banana) hypothetical protein n=1 Tax=Musa acuminata subsp. malaccensis TaxID=214687 RepID=A0A804KAW8_MUSAM|nr:unnamed protein product [Musa acuminata subsp. malaccensis]